MMRKPVRAAVSVAIVLLLARAGVAAPLPAAGGDLQQYGRAWLAEGDNRAAVQSWTELVRQNPFDAVALNNMAVAKAAAGDWQTALDLLARAVQLAPQRGDIRDNHERLLAWLQQNHAVKLNLTPTRARGIGNPATVWAEPPPLWESAVRTLPPTGLSAPAPLAQEAEPAPPAKRASRRSKRKP